MQFLSAGAKTWSQRFSDSKFPASAYPLQQLLVPGWARPVALKIFNQNTITVII